MAEQMVLSELDIFKTGARRLPSCLLQECKKDGSGVQRRWVLVSMAHDCFQASLHFCGLLEWFSSLANGMTEQQTEAHELGIFKTGARRLPSCLLQECKKDKSSVQRRWVLVSMAHDCFQAPLHFCDLLEWFSWVANGMTEQQTEAHELGIFKTGAWRLPSCLLQECKKDGSGVQRRWVLVSMAHDCFQASLHFCGLLEWFSSLANGMTEQQTEAHELGIFKTGARRLPSCLLQECKKDGSGVQRRWVLVSMAHDCFQAPLHFCGLLEWFSSLANGMTKQQTETHELGIFKTGAWRLPSCLLQECKKDGSGVQRRWVLVSMAHDCFQASLHFCGLLEWISWLANGMTEQQTEVHELGIFKTGAWRLPSCLLQECKKDGSGVQRRWVLVSMAHDCFQAPLQFCGLLEWFSWLANGMTKQQTEAHELGIFKTGAWRLPSCLLQECKKDGSGVQRRWVLVSMAHDCFQAPLQFCGLLEWFSWLANGMTKQQTEAHELGIFKTGAWRLPSCLLQECKKDGSGVQRRWVLVSMAHDCFQAPLQFFVDLKKNSVFKSHQVRCHRHNHPCYFYHHYQHHNLRIFASSSWQY